MFFIKNRFRAVVAAVEGVEKTRPILGSQQQPHRDFPVLTSVAAEGVPGAKLHTLPLKKLVKSTNSMHYNGNQIFRHVIHNYQMIIFIM